MNNIMHYNESEIINTDIEIFDREGKTSIDIVQAFISREDLRRISVNTDTLFISCDPCDICGNDALTLHCEIAGIDVDGDLILYDICRDCWKALQA